MLLTAGSPPSWASGVSSDRTHGNRSPQLQQAQPQSQTQPELNFAEPSFATFDFLQTQSEQDAEYARNATLPPLESVLELTDAVRPPLRGEEPQMASTSGAGTSTICVNGCHFALHLISTLLQYWSGPCNTMEMRQSRLLMNDRTWSPIGSVSVSASACICSNFTWPAMLFGVGFGAPCCGANQRLQDIHCNRQ